MTAGDVPRGAWRYLWLLRHAKTREEPPAGGGDHARVLSPRGRRDADALGRRLGAGGDRLGLLPLAPIPSLVLCSTAARTVETADRVLARFDPPPIVLRDRSIYGASPDELLEELRVVDADADAVMVVAHNPGIHQLAVGMVVPGPASEHLARAGMRTSGLIVIGLPVARWLDIGAGCGTLLGEFGPPYGKDD